MIRNSIFVIGFLLISLFLMFGADKLYTTLVDVDGVDKDKQVTAVVKPPNINSTEIIESPSISAYSVLGFDWSLPENAPISPNSGLIDEYDRGFGFIQNVFQIIRWDDANPKQGEYDFSLFEKRLKEASSKKALVRLEVNSICEAPKWAHKILRSSQDKSLIFWDDTYIDVLRPFINAFAKRYANDPRIIGVQLGIGDGEYRNNSCDFSNKDGWGEFWMSPTALAIAQDKYSLTPDIFEAQTKKIINIYTNAFTNNRGKLVFTNIGPNFSWNEIGDAYNKKLKHIAQYVAEAGLGNRDGNIELWMRYIDQAYGVELRSMEDGTCFLTFDESFANTIKGRYWGTENEFYGNKAYVIEANGPYENQAYRFMVSSLRSLQMRRNFSSIVGDSMAKITDPIYKTNDFLVYLTKVMGKQIENTPDAFILLGERYISQSHASNFSKQACVQNQDKVAIRSFGRWLTEKSNSQGALKVSMPASENYWGQNYYLPNGIDYEYSARTGKQFEFDINDEIIKKRCKNECKVEVKISYKDTAKTALNIHYGDNSAQVFNTKADNRIKTTTFTVNSSFQNKQTGSDFIITSDEPLPLIMIRVNFL